MNIILIIIAIALLPFAIITTVYIFALAISIPFYIASLVRSAFNYFLEALGFR